MFAVPLQDRSTIARVRPLGWTGVAWLLVGAGLLAPIAAAPAEPACPQPAQSCGASAALDRLALTIGNLKASLSAMRGDLGAPADEVPRAIVDRLCAAPVADAQAAREHAAAAMTGELISLRGRLAAAEAQVARLTEDRATLVTHIVELDATLEPGAGALVPARAEPWRTAAIPSAEAAEIGAVAKPPLLRPAQHDQPAPAARVDADDQRAPASADRLQLAAELALAQLKIAELATALESARVRQAAVEAEVGTLRSLTDAKIRQLLGWR